MLVLIDLLEGFDVFGTGVDHHELYFSHVFLLSVLIAAWHVMISSLYSPETVFADHRL
jgi:hypothetical protein